MQGIPTSKQSMTAPQPYEPTQIAFPSSDVSPYNASPSLPPPPPPPTPRRSRKRLWLIISIIAAVLVVSIIGAIVTMLQMPRTSTPPAAQSTQQATTQPTWIGTQIWDAPTQTSVTQPTQQVTPQPTSPPINTIGQPIQVGDTWVVTVNSMQTHGPGQYFQPKSGNTYLIVNVTLKNTSSSIQNVSSLLMFTLKDETGQKYNETIVDFAKPPPDGKVSAGGLMRGEMVYEVPASMHSFTFSFEPSFLGNDLVEWNVKV